MSDDGWGPGDANPGHSGDGGGGDRACRKCGEVSLIIDAANIDSDQSFLLQEGHFAKECPQGGGGGDNKCRNCRQVTQPCLCLILR